jgi:hypothetical protein
MSALRIGVVAATVCLCGSAVAQSDVALETRAARLLEMSQRLQERDANDRSQAQAYAKSAGIPSRRNLPGGGVLELQRIVPGAGPVFYVTNNVDAADSVSTDELRPGKSAGLNLEGAGMIVAEWDGGAVYAGHPDFFGRLTQMDGAVEVSGHSTHVAGTLVGAGEWLEPRSRGMAYAAQLNAWDWNSDTAEMAAAAAGGLLLSNHSYGIAAGWLYLGDLPPNGWWWIGGAANTDLEDPNFGYYDAESRLWDQIAFDAPYYLIVKAGGNDRSDIGPAPGEEYTIVDQDGNFLSTSTLPRPPDCAPAGYDCLPTNSVAKNVLTVGAVDDVPGGYSPLSGPSQVQMAPFSSWGPSDDGRIKPDIVGNGVFLISAWPDSPYYAAAAGSSMAAPNVTGSLLLLQEHYEDIHGPNNFMRAATLQALAIHTADESGAADGPDYAFGWGLLNAKNAAAVISGDGVDHQIIEGSLANGVVDSIPVNVAQPDSQVTATLVWMDPPGTPVAPSLDPPDLMLVNDLDLRISDGPATYLPWVLNPANPAAAATRGDNFRDNVEQVEVVGVGTGLLTVEVSHKGGLLDGLNQDYTLIISVTPAPPVGSGLLIDEDFSGGLPAGWSLETNTDPVVNWAIQSPVPGGSRLDNLTGGTGQFAMADFGYVTSGAASLRTPLLDLSANNAAVLRFRSQHNYDTWESLNVDTSTDGGFSWSNQWSFQGFNPFPTLNVLDLSAAIAGQPNVMLRFRYDSWMDYSGDYWQIDDVELETFGGNPPPGEPPGLAGGPSPGDGAIDVALDTVLGWNAGTDADSHDVYFGTNPLPGGAEFQGNLPAAVTAFDPGTLEPLTTHYWRVDEVNEAGTTTGQVWSFSTQADASPAASLHLGDLQGNGFDAPRGRWNAVVTISVADASDLPLAGVQVEGGWSDGANGADSCITDDNGECSVTRQNLKSNVASVDFMVNDLLLGGHTYIAGDNLVPAAIAVSKPEPNLLPVAANDSFSTPVNTQLAENVMTNDDQGDAPASVTPFDINSAQGFVVSMATDGNFTYTPTGGFEGSDTFGYTITDNNGDSSSAVVEVTVGDAPSVRTVTASKSKDKGNHVVIVTWSGFIDANVTISRDTEIAVTVENSAGQWQDNVGKKPAGNFVYKVCEASSPADCASDSVSY